MIAPACRSRARFRFALAAPVLAPTVFVAIPAAAQLPTFPTSATNPLPLFLSNLNGAQLTLDVSLRTGRHVQTLLRHPKCRTLLCAGSPNGRERQYQRSLPGRREAPKSDALLQRQF